MKFIKLFLVVFLFIGCIPINVFAEEEKSSLIPNAVSGILIDADSGKIIYEKDMNKEAAVASMTKMVGQILIMEAIEDGKIKWDDVITVS